MEPIIIQCLQPNSSIPDGNSYDAEEPKNTPIDTLSEYTSERVRRYATDTDLRKHITYSFIINVSFGLSSVISVLYFNNVALKLHLSDAVLITLLTTSTLNVIGMMTIILKNLFPIQAEKQKSQPVLTGN